MGNVWVCDIAAGVDSAPSTMAQPENYLKPSVTVPSDALAIRDLAHNIAGTA